MHLSIGGTGVMTLPALSIAQPDDTEMTNVASVSHCGHVRLLQSWRAAEMAAWKEYV